jgi:hypothetical protein
MSVYILCGISVLVVMLLYIIYNLYRKVLSYEMWSDELQTSLTNTIEKWKILDNKQIFERDDEVGVVFDEINTAINELEQRME